MIHLHNVFSSTWCPIKLLQDRAQTWNEEINRNVSVPMV